MDGRFTEEELAIAKSVDLCAVAESLGYTVKRIGKYHTLKEMDSIRIYNRSHWYRWSRQYDKGNNGGSQIDFLRVFCGMNVRDAVFWLLDFAGYRRIESANPKPLVHQVEKPREEERKEFILPQPAGDNSYLISYLNQERGISKTVIEWFLRTGLIYESRHYHNVVFKGNDKDGVTRFASMRGVFDKQGKPFKCDVAGNDKNYGFNVVNEDSTELVVFEAAIDLMSYMDKKAVIVKCKVKRYRRAKMSGLQKKYYAKLYRVGKLKKRPYSQVWKYKDDIRKMEKLQAQYLFLARHEVHSAEELVAVVSNLTDKKKEASREKSRTYKAKARFQPIFEIADKIKELDAAKECYQNGDDFFEAEYNQWNQLCEELKNQGYSIDEVEALRKKYADKYSVDCAMERAASKELKIGQSIWNELVSVTEANVREEQIKENTRNKDRKEQPRR